MTTTWSRPTVNPGNSNSGLIKTKFTVKNLIVVSQQLNASRNYVVTLHLGLYSHRTAYV